MVFAGAGIYSGINNISWMSFPLWIIFIPIAMLFAVAVMGSDDSDDDSDVGRASKTTQDDTEEEETDDFGGTIHIDTVDGETHDYECETKAELKKEFDNLKAEMGMGKTTVSIDDDVFPTKNITKIYFEED